MRAKPRNPPVRLRTRSLVRHHHVAPEATRLLGQLRDLGNRLVWCAAHRQPGVVDPADAQLEVGASRPDSAEAPIVRWMYAQMHPLRDTRRQWPSPLIWPVASRERAITSAGMAVTPYSAARFHITPSAGAAPSKPYWIVAPTERMPTPYRQPRPSGRSRPHEYRTTGRERADQWRARVQQAAVACS